MYESYQGWPGPHRSEHAQVHYFSLDLHWGAWMCFSSANTHTHIQDVLLFPQSIFVLRFCLCLLWLCCLFMLGSGAAFHQLSFSWSAFPPHSNRNECNRIKHEGMHAKLPAPLLSVHVVCLCRPNKDWQANMYLIWPSERCSQGWDLLKGNVQWHIHAKPVHNMHF